jgi:hypothetical protein
MLRVLTIALLLGQADWGTSGQCTITTSTGTGATTAWGACPHSCVDDQVIVHNGTSSVCTVNPRVGFAWSTGLTDGVAQITETQAATGTPLFASGNPNAALLTAVGGLPNTTQSWPATVAATIAAGATPSGTTRVQLASETAGTNVTIKAVGSFCRYRTFTN